MSNFKILPCDKKHKGHDQDAWVVAMLAYNLLISF